MNVEMPDGTIIENVPDNYKQSDLLARYNKLSAQPQDKMSALEAFNLRARDALSMGFAPAIDAAGGVAAGAVKGLFGGDNSKTYDDYLREYKEREVVAKEQHPTASTVGDIAGFVGGIATAAPAKGAVALKNISLGRQMAKGAKTAGGILGAQQAATTEGDWKQKTKAGLTGAALGGTLGAALPATIAGGGAIVRGTKDAIIGASARSPEAITKAAETMKVAGSDLYGKMREIGAVFNEQKTSNILMDINKALEGTRFIPELNPTTRSIVSAIEKRAKDGTLGLDDLDQYRRMLGRIGQTEDGAAAGAVRKAIDNATNTATKADLAAGTEEAVSLLTKGREQYAKASRFETVADVIAKADGDPNRIKINLKRFVLNNDLKKMGFNAEEIAAIKDAARSGVGEKVLRMFGKFGFDLGTSLTPGNTVLPAIGGMAAGSAGSAGVGGAVVAGGTAAREAQKLLARGKAEKALRLIESRASGVSTQPTATNKMSDKIVADYILSMQKQGAMPSTMGYNASPLQSGLLARSLPLISGD